MTGIRAIRLVTQDADRLAAFYVEALGFAPEDTISPLSDPFCGSLRRFRTLSLGHERIELIESLTPGAPADVVAANDVRFQNFALVAPSMDRAHARLCRLAGWNEITRSGPQQLPASSGGVTAFKFRDPDGHPLELLSFPESACPDHWVSRSAETDGPLIGIDHTAVVVSDTAQSLAHYARLGFQKTGGSINTGPAQAALDGLEAPRVEVTSLRTGPSGTPHLELLCYGPGTRLTRAGDADILATRIIGAGGGKPMVDPDGHRWIEDRDGAI